MSRGYANENCLKLPMPKISVTHCVTWRLIQESRHSRRSRSSHDSRPKPLTSLVANCYDLLQTIAVHQYRD